MTVPIQRLRNKMLTNSATGEGTARNSNMTQRPTAHEPEHDQRLLSQVRPDDWINPTPNGRYNLVVIGAGTAGLVTAAAAAGLGAKVALVERSRLGGDCLNWGCVPSKALIAAARSVRHVRDARQFGIRVPDTLEVDFPAVMNRVRRLRAKISPNDSAHRFRDLGVDVFFGQARFVDSTTIEVGETKLLFHRAVIATGARPSVPRIDGLDQIQYLTNETVFDLKQLPSRLAVIGAGPIGCELAQAFAQLGSTVTLCESNHGILPREDRRAAEVVQKAIERDGVQILCCGQNLRIENSADGLRLLVESHGNHVERTVDQVLVAAGRTPNVEQLNLEAIGVEYDGRGICVNDFLRTTNSRIYACGDVCSPYKFTHAADFMARIVVRNALFLGRQRFSSLAIPWCTYTTPELAHVGLSNRDIQEQGLPVNTFRQELHEIDRAILEGDDEGFVEVHVRRGSDKILGATVVARNAGDLISEITLAMQNDIGLKRIAGTIHPYPTQAEAIRKLGDQFQRRRLTPLVHGLFSTWQRWLR